MPDLGEPGTLTLAVSPFGGSTAATVTLTAPDGAVTGPAAASSSDGGATWTYAVASWSQVGWWLIKWIVTGTGAGTQWQQVNVTGAPPTPVQPLVASLEEFKVWLRISPTRTTDDPKLLAVLASATEWLEWRIGGPLSVTSYTHRLRCNGWNLVPLKLPLVAVASITPERGAALDASSYVADTTSGIIRLYTPITPCYAVTVYSAGLASIPGKEKNAGMELARHLWLTQNGSIGRGRSDDDIPVPMGFAVPRRVDELLENTPRGMGFA